VNLCVHTLRLIAGILRLHVASTIAIGIAIGIGFTGYGGPGLLKHRSLAGCCILYPCGIEGVIGLWIQLSIQRYHPESRRSGTHQPRAPFGRLRTGRPGLTNPTDSPALKGHDTNLQIPQQMNLPTIILHFLLTKHRGGGG
jgi:hypothetical protein